jgi:hypothetical protein
MATDMAFLFQLAIECGNDSNIAKRVKSHFDGHSFLINEDGGWRFVVDTMSPDEDGRWWVSVSGALGSALLESKAETTLIESVRAELYERLKSVSGYRFAIAGVEPYQFNRLESLVKLLEHPALKGLVVSKEVFHELGEPRDFTNFAPNYLWRQA